MAVAGAERLGLCLQHAMPDRADMDGTGESGMYKYGNIKTKEVKNWTSTILLGLGS